MKRVMVTVLAVILFYAQCASGEQKRRDACEAIPKRALDRAERALTQVYPAWGAIPVEGDDGQWRCKASGAFVRRYDKTAGDKRIPVGIPLYVDKDGSIFICDTHGRFSIDRWK